jgi:hypothetical protein
MPPQPGFKPPSPIPNSTKNGDFLRQDKEDKKSNLAAGIGKNLMGSVIKQQANAADKQAKELEE